MKEDRLDLLLHALLEDSLDEVERAELNDLLTDSVEARLRYRRTMALHSALARKAAAPSYFEAPASAKLIRFPKPWLAACAALALLAAASVFFIARPKGPVATVMETQGISWAEGSPAPVSGRVPVAVPVEFTRGFEARLSQRCERDP